MNTHIWWYTARATGIVAWALATCSVLWGMALSTRALGKRPRAPWLLDLHRFLGGLTVLFLFAHIASLMADSYVSFDLKDVLVPFAASWKPAAVAAGVVAMYLLLAVEVTSLGMKRLPKRLWKGIHLSSYGVYVLATGHYLFAGTDASAWGSRVAMLASTCLVLFFLVYLIVGPGRAASVRSGAGRAAAATPRVPRSPRTPPSSPATSASSRDREPAVR